MFLRGKQNVIRLIDDERKKNKRIRPIRTHTHTQVQVRVCVFTPATRERKSYTSSVASCPSLRKEKVGAGSFRVKSWPCIVRSDHPFSRVCARPRPAAFEPRNAPDTARASGASGKGDRRGTMGTGGAKLRAQVARCRCVRPVGRSRRSLARENHVRERERETESGVISLGDRAWSREKPTESERKPAESQWRIRGHAGV